MSRGGTRKARARQDARRRTIERKARARQRDTPKPGRPKRVKRGRGRAAVLHLSGFAAPLVLALGLTASGQRSDDASEFWLADLISKPNASYFSEPIGLVYFGFVAALSASIFVVSPVGLWRRLYRERGVLERDWSSIDSALTMLVITAIAWMFRIVVGHTDTVGSFAVIMAILAVYVPIFSALLAIGMPVVPGSGRIGGILPGFLRLGFTQRFLLTDDEREELRVFEQMSTGGAGTAEP